MRSVIAMVISMFCITCVAQESEFPKNLVGFLKPGMHIGVVSIADSDRITIEVYSEQDYAIAIDSRELSLEELSSKYDRVATELERKRKEILTSLESQRIDLPTGKEFGEPEISLRASQREAFYKIIAAGEDYILVSNSVGSKRRRAIATRFISAINWRDELPFIWSVPHVDKAEARTK